MKTVTARVEIQVDDRMTDDQIVRMLELVVLPGANEIVKVAVAEAKVVIVVQGGLVQNVVTSEPCKVVIIDYDVDGTMDDELVNVPQNDGTVTLANVYQDPPQVDSEMAGQLADLA